MPIEFDGKWVVVNETLANLREAGYAVAGWHDEKKDEYRYAIYRYDSPISEIILDTTDQAEINRYVKLLLGSEDESR